MLVLALVGWLPRPMLVLPLVVWLAGVSTWAYASRAAGRQALAQKTSIPLAAKPREVFLRGDYQVATELVADYEFDVVYTEFHRHQLAKGSPDCTPLPQHDPNRLMSSPPKLRARGECVISHRIDAPPGNLIEVARLKPEAPPTANGAETVPLKITAQNGGQEKSWTVKLGTARVPGPVLFPIVGFFYGSRDGQRGTIAEMWRLDYPLVPGANNDNPNEARARFIAQTLGVGRRPGV